MCFVFALFVATCTVLQVLYIVPGIHLRYIRYEPPICCRSPHTVLLFCNTIPYFTMVPAVFCIMKTVSPTYILKIECNSSYHIQILARQTSSQGCVETRYSVIHYNLGFMQINDIMMAHIWSWHRHKSAPLSHSYL